MRNDLVFSPWTELNRMWNLMDRTWPTRDFELTGVGIPIDVYQQDDRVCVRASVPGVKPEDLNVSLDQGVLTITGEFNDSYEKDRQGSKMFHREHSYGKFLRSVRLPSDVDENSIDAQFENGVLTVSMPLSKPQKTEPKKIPIGSTSTATRSIGSGAYADGQQDKAGNQTGNEKREKAASHN